MTALHPCMSVGEQITEAVRLRQPKLTKKERLQKAAELMELVGLDHPAERAKQYPAQLSGGMAQRCVIAIALAAEPAVLFADEATTALDVTVQAQILELFLELRKKMGMSILLITHSPGVAARTADRVALMKSSNVAQDAAAEMSINLAGLAGDLASFYNLDTDEAFYKLRAAIAGETEPLKALGINMNIVNLEAYAMSQGITWSTP